jgi:hypothetical protein
VFHFGQLHVGPSYYKVSILTETRPDPLKAGSWPFLLEVQKRLGFGSVWCDIISGLLASSSTQVLLNGSLGQRIQHQRGLRQDDPLSPMLFILVMDVLCHLVKKAMDEQLF